MSVPQPIPGMPERRHPADFQGRLMVSNLPYTVNEYDLNKFKEFGQCTISLRRYL